MTRLDFFHEPSFPDLNGVKSVENTTVIIFIFIAVAAFFFFRTVQKPGLQKNAEGEENFGGPSKNRFDPGPCLADNLNLEWEISYTDRNGECTERRITVRSLYGKKYPKFVFAFCHLRNEMRHFDLYSISRAIEVDTGYHIPVTYQLIPWINDHQNRLRDVQRQTTITTDVSGFGVTLIIETGGETFTVDVEHAEANGDRSIIRGKARRAKTSTKRAWSGQKSFYSNTCTTVALAETGEVFDPDSTFRILANGQVPISPSSSTH